MTTLSAEHIRKFEKAKNFQEGWTPEVGDRYARRNGEIEFMIGSSCPKGIANQFFIFLPSTDQMAEMWHEWMNTQNSRLPSIEVHAEQPASTFIFYLNQFINGDMADWPLQVIVLAFIQSDLHGLTWSDTEGWVDA